LPHDVHNWYWSIVALCIIGRIGYVNAEINARINRTENTHIMLFYGRQLRMLHVSALAGVRDEVLWLQLGGFARRTD
jgi:hypothetical protein